MFDSETVRLIQSAEPLAELDLERLPQFLTEAYAKVVAARLGAVRLDAGYRDDEWDQNIRQLRRLADTYEGLSIFLPDDNPHRAACAFVAGSAHHTLSQARSTEARIADQEVTDRSLSLHGVGPEVAACLLFLIGGQQADAAETSKRFVKPDDAPFEAELLRGIAALASGDGQRLRSFVAGRTAAEPVSGPHDYLREAADALWAGLARSVVAIARIALGLEVQDDPGALIDDVLDRIGRARKAVDAGGVAFVVRPNLEGPYHVARLLRRVSDLLLATAVTSLPPPTGVDAGRWANFTQAFAGRRPFLWRNHLSSFEQGFLDPGTSSVLTFPTGAGKTTITELRIAAELLRGLKVVYLAPTRALVDQVSTELGRTLVPIAQAVVRGRFLEDFGEKAAERVFVHTPEQCLAYLSFDEDAHTDVGLIVVDECHQLSGEFPGYGSSRLPGRRPVDAMWTLLSLLQRSADADVVLISAMVRNGQALGDWLEAATGRPAAVLELPWKPTRQVRGVVVYEAHDIKQLKNDVWARRRARGTGVPRKADKADIEAQPVGLFCHTQVWATDSSFAKFPILPGPVPLTVGPSWGITANRNTVGGLLLAEMAKAGMRPIVFSQQVGWTSKIADGASSTLTAEGVPAVAITDDEQALFDAAAIELGDAEHVEGLSGDRVGIHHGLLLWPERAAVESAFRRPDGLLGLVATPTVAQGINLPAEAVVIAGDDRWIEDMDESGMQPLAVHELLNAAGRAGRAGHYAHGIVIDLPGQILTVSQKDQTYLVSDLDHIMSLFGLPDQCLDVIDPITQIIDRVQAAGVDADVCDYVVRRAAGIPEDLLVNILGSSLGNSTRPDRDARAASQATFLRSVGATLDDEQDDAEGLELDDWREFASLVGVSPVVAASTAAKVPTPEAVSRWEFDDLLDFAILEVARQLFALVSPGGSGLARIIPRVRKKVGRAYEFTETVAEWENRWRAVIPDVLRAWMSGTPVAEIGVALHRHRGATGHVKAIHLGRRFALHSASSLAHGVSVVVRVFEAVRGEAPCPELTAQLPLVAGCVREGFDEPDKLLLFWHLRRHAGLYPRVAIHNEFDRLRAVLPSWKDVGDIEARRAHIRRLWSCEESG
ncbi:MAG: DEAD/DEAH box helicase [Thermodesulfobacteriota bacterium]|nr:DEAD/DEAH box helicase [Thermodesulfobacteriota bacterium]